MPAGFDARLQKLRKELAAFESEVEASKAGGATAGASPGVAPTEDASGVSATSAASAPRLRAGGSSRVNEAIRGRLDYAVPDFSADLRRLAEAEEARQASRAKLQALLDGIEGELRNPIFANAGSGSPSLSAGQGADPGSVLNSSELEARARILLGEEELDDVQKRIVQELQAVEQQKAEEDRLADAGA